MPAPSASREENSVTSTEGTASRDDANRRPPPLPIASLAAASGDVIDDAAGSSSLDDFKAQGAIPKGTKSKGKKKRKSRKGKENKGELTFANVDFKIRRAYRELDEIEKGARKRKADLRDLQDKMGKVPSRSPLSNLYSAPPKTKIRRLSSSLKTSPLETVDQVRGETDGVPVARSPQPAVDPPAAGPSDSLPPAFADAEDDGGILVEDAETFQAIAIDDGIDGAAESFAAISIGPGDLRRRISGSRRGRGPRVRSPIRAPDARKPDRREY